MLDPPVLLRTPDGQPISYYTSSSFELTARDGTRALLVQDHSSLWDKGMVGIRVFRTPRGAPATTFKDAGRIEGFADRSTLAFRAAATSAFDGLLVNHGSSSGKVRYYRRETSGRRLRFVDQGFLLQRNAYVSTYSGYAQGWLWDRDGDGDWDLTAGCETGFIQRFENTGSQRRPVFAEPEFLTIDGEPIELLNGPFDDPGSFMEATIGQTAPMEVDWDADGTVDLVVTIGRRLLYFHNEGTTVVPRYAEPREILTRDRGKVAKHRNKPALVDWNGDGLLDVVGHDEEENRLLLFERARGAGGSLELAGGRTLTYDDGITPIAPSAWHRYTKYYNAADWKGRGVFDVLLSTSDLILCLENVGTNQAPRFLPPVRFTVDGKPIVVGHHVSTPLPVDWDRRGTLDLFVSGESGLFHLFRRSYLEGAHRRIRCTIHEVGPGPGLGAAGSAP